MQTIPDGLWKQSVDFKPGLYRAPGGNGCYWATLQTANPTGGIIESGGAASTQTLEIVSPYFETHGCGKWSGAYESWGPAKTTIPDGVWKLSVDFEPGLYRAPGGNGCYWATLQTANPTGGIIESGGGPGSRRLEVISPYFETQACGQWKKIPPASPQSTGSVRQRMAIQDGIWKLGVGYDPILYRAPGGKNCHWAALESSDPGGEIIEQGGADNTQTLWTTWPYFETHGCGTWNQDYEDWGPVKPTIPDGIWKREVDFEVGRYRAPGGRHCHWAVLASAHPTTAISEKGGGEGSQTAEILSSYFETVGCGRWKRID
jgi:hypothetical protein